jgi:hypothetical protein
MNKKMAIEIIESSSVSFLASLLLSENQIKHNFYVKEIPISYLSLDPLSSPITNRTSQQLEKKFLSEKVLSKLEYIEQYHFEWFHSSPIQLNELTGRFQFPVYAIDNRLRLQNFWESLLSRDNVNVIKGESSNQKNQPDLVKIKVFGGGEKNSVYFKDNVNLPRERFTIKREIVYFNLVPKNEILNKHNKLRMISIHSTADITLYPFLNKEYETSISLVLSITKGGTWDVFEDVTSLNVAWEKTIELLGIFKKELSDELFQNFNLEDTNIFQTSVSPFFKEPFYRDGTNLVFGLGEVIAKNDPITAQGYNSGILIASKLVEAIVSAKTTNDYTIVTSSYMSYANLQLEHLFHLNMAFTQICYNYGDVYKHAASNSSLKDFIMSCYEDYTLYFPWLIDEFECEKLIHLYSNKTR